MNYDALSDILRGMTAKPMRGYANTCATRIDDETIAITFYDTNILYFKKDGTFVVAFSNDGETNKFNTATTRKRLNEFLPKPWLVCNVASEPILWIPMGVAEHQIVGHIVIDEHGEPSQLDPFPYY